MNPAISSPDGRPLLMLHIPKTAGTSIRTALFPDQTETHHVPAARIDVDTWNGSFKFAFVRDPYDRTVSMYRYHTQRKYRGMLRRRHPDLPGLSFDEYLDRFVATQMNDLFLPQMAYLTHPATDNSVDFIGRFERLHDDYTRLCQVLGADSELPQRLVLPAKKWQRFYDESSLRIVEDVFGVDFEQLGYAHLTDKERQRIVNRPPERRAGQGRAAKDDDTEDAP